MKLRTALGIVTVAAIVASPAIAGGITYTVSGTGSGRYLDLTDPNATVTGFGPAPIAFVGHGVLPAGGYPGVVTVPLVAGEIDGLLGGAAILVGAQSVFAVAGGANLALFGDFDGTNFMPSIVFSGLGGYDAVSGLRPTPVTVVDFAPFPFTAGGHLYGVEFDGFTGASFTAAVPEPASWALLIAGFAATGAVLRRAARARPSPVR